MSALRYDEGKPKWHMLRKAGNALVHVIRVFEQGAVKYEVDNWLKGGKNDEEYLDALDRHAQKIADGEFYDTESGCSHYGHIIANCIMALRCNYPDAPGIDPEFDQDAYLVRWGQDNPPPPQEPEPVEHLPAIVLHPPGLAKAVLGLLADVPYPDGLHRKNIWHALEGSTFDGKPLTWAMTYSMVMRLERAGLIEGMSRTGPYRIATGRPL
ncbi:MAG: hypothetical protein HKN01_01390 [Acidimicrobiia bacterium]|nr:hypothetical protein [Acidimicrobiia bacterium]